MSRYAELRQRAEQAEAKIKQREFEAFLSSDEMRTKVSPAMREELIEILEFASATEAWEFSAPDPADENKTVKVKQPPAERIKAFMRRYLPDIITFGEVATKKKSGAKTTGAGGTMADILETSRQALEFQKAEAAAGRTITITEAVNHVVQS